MTQLLTANIGSYPRIGDHKDQQRHRRGFTHYERKEISAHAFRDVEQSVVQEVIGDELSAGLDEVTDGLVTWQDPISHFCRNISGVVTTGLNRYFSTNFYYRQPVFVSKPRLSSPQIVKEFTIAQNLSNKAIRVVLTGPYTLAAHTAAETKTLSKLPNRFDFFCDLLTQEIKNLDEAGVQVIQIDEPSLAANPMDFKRYGKALETMMGKSKISIKFILALYFSPLAKLWANLQNLPIPSLQLDFTKEGDALFQKMMENPGTKEIGLGLLDARNTRLEAAEPIIARVRQWMDRTSAPMCYLTPSSGLEFLPRSYASAKLQFLTQLRNQISQETDIVNSNV